MPIWCSVRRMVWALTGWPPTPSTSWSNAGRTHTSISQTQPLDMTLSMCTQLLWSTMARPVLSGTCPVKTAVWSWPPCCSLVSGSWQSSYSLRHLYVEQQFFFFQILREFFAMRCHVELLVTSMREREAITPNSTHLLPIHTWDLVTLTSHMTLGRENG